MSVAKNIDAKTGHLSMFFLIYRAISIIMTYFGWFILV